MYEQKYVTLPGGRTLPIAIISEHYVSFQKSTELPSEFGADTEIESRAQQYLHTQMIAGEIKHAITEKSLLDDCWLLNGIYSCQESIERVIYEGRIDNYG